MSQSRGRGKERDQDKHREFVRLKIQRIEREKIDSEQLEDAETHDASFAAGAPAADSPRNEDEQVRDEPDESDEDTPSGPLTEDSDDEPPRTWARDTLLRGRPPMVVVRLRDAGEYAEPHSTLAPKRGSSRAMLENLCDFLRDRFGPLGRALFSDLADWEKLLGRTPTGPAERLALLSRLSVTGQHEYARASGTASGSDIGLGHYVYKFASLPDGMPFSIRLLLARGDSGLKDSAPGDSLAFATLPLALRLLALATALRREREEKRVRSDELFRVLLRDEAVRLLGGVSLPAISVTAVRRFREWLERNGHGVLFPSAPDRKKALAGETA